MSDQALVGISVSLVQNQKIMYAKGFGVSEKRISNTELTNYRIASITKILRVLFTHLSKKFS